MVSAQGGNGFDSDFASVADSEDYGSFLSMTPRSGEYISVNHYCVGSNASSASSEGQSDPEDLENMFDFDRATVRRMAEGVSVQELTSRIEEALAAATQRRQREEGDTGIPMCTPSSIGSASKNANAESNLEEQVQRAMAGARLRRRQSALRRGREADTPREAPVASSAVISSATTSSSVNASAVPSIKGMQAAEKQSVAPSNEGMELRIKEAMTKAVRRHRLSVAQLAKDSARNLKQSGNPGCIYKGKDAALQPASDEVAGQGVQCWKPSLGAA